MKKRSIDYIIPKLTVFTIPVMIASAAYDVDPGVAMSVWASICLAFLVQNRKFRREEARAAAKEEAEKLAQMPGSMAYIASLEARLRNLEASR